MKKRIILVMLALVLLVCVSCSQGEPADTTETDNVTSENILTTDAPEPIEESIEESESEADSCSSDMDDNINNLKDSASTKINVEGSATFQEDDNNRMDESTVYIPTRIDTEDYSIIENNGRYYIVFTDESQFKNYEESQVSATVDFKTIQEFKDRVIKGELSDWEKVTISNSFGRDENGILSCDFNKLYEPVMPLGGMVTSVSWEGEFYGFGVEIGNNIFGFVNYYTPAIYKSIFEYKYENFFDRDTITVTRTEQIGDGQKIATYYRTFAGEFMQLRYTLQNGTKTIVVEKTFRLAMSNEMLTTSSTVPFDISLYCIDEGVHCVMDLYGFSEDPSDEWLMQFGMTQYVENSLSVK